MRKFLIVGASVMLFAAPVLAQSISTETTTTTKERSQSLAPAPIIVQPVPAAPGISESRSSVTRSGDGGESRTDKRSDTYIGVDGTVHKDQSITHEEQR